MKSARIAVIAVFATTALLATACGDGPPASSGSGSSSGKSIGTVANGSKGDFTVKETTTGGAQKFDPNATTVKVGQIVEWDNADSVAHNVTFADDPNVSIGNMNPGDKWAVKFTTAGSYNYQCTFHAGMTGTITVS